ncbi:MAG: hypothetical protein ACHQ53_06690 [Polyangiales bacterium]
MPSAQTDFEALSRSVSSLADDTLRASFVRHTLLAKRPEEVADLFTVAMSSAESREPTPKRLLQAISLAFADEACDALREAVAAVLLSRQQWPLARALQRVQIEEDADTQRIPDFGKGRILTLGERKSIARRNDRTVLARCLRDPHPHVMRILLGNPSVTEDDLVRLCARRPASTEVLREVFRSARWIVRYQVKVALALNPYTPVDIALQLAPHMKLQDLRRLIAASELHQELREAARRCIGRTAETTVH